MRTLQPLHRSETPRAGRAPNLSPAIAFEGPSHGHWNLSKICKQMSEKFDNFLINSSPPGWIPDKQNCLDKVWTNLGFGAFFGSAKTDPVRFKWGFGEGLLQDKFAFCEALQILYLRGEISLQNAHVYEQKGAFLKGPLNWTGSVSPLLRNWAAAEGGQNVPREFGGGKRTTAECALQNHFWRPQKLGWSGRCLSLLRK